MLSLRTSQFSRGDRINLRKMMRESAIAARSGRNEDGKEDDGVSITRDAQWEQETRVLACATVSSTIALFLHLAAVSTDFWLIVDYTVRRRFNDTEETLTRVYSGVWRSCRIFSTKVGRAEKTCTESEVFLTKDDEEEVQLLKDFALTEKSFSIISVTFMFIAACASIYTLRRPHYPMKRISAILNVIAAGSTLVCVEIFNRAKQHPSSKCLQYKDSKPRYGFSFFIVWFVLIVYCASSSLFILYSWRRGGMEPPLPPPKINSCPECTTQHSTTEDGRRSSQSEPLNRTCNA